MKVYWLIILAMHGYAVKSQGTEEMVFHRAEKALTDVIVHDIFSPPVATRLYAYSNMAAYEVLVQKHPDYRSLQGQIKDFPRVPKPVGRIDYTLAAVSAFFEVAKGMISSENVLSDSAQDILAALKPLNDKNVYESSIDYGHAVADIIRQWSMHDHYREIRGMRRFSFSKAASSWQPTPPGFMAAVEPNWHLIRPMTLDAANQFPPPAAISFSMDTASKFYHEAREVYQIGNGLTNEQKAIAGFWDCNPFALNIDGHLQFASKKISPGGHWMAIAGAAAQKAKAPLIQASAAYTLTAIALFDAFISCWEEKYRSNVIRPETFINRYIDEQWRPFLQTPPFPEYSSGHSVASVAAATVLSSIFGNAFEFIDSTEIQFGLKPRHFSSFLQASQEASLSRLYGGIHYRAAIERGQLQGGKVGEWVLGKIMLKSPVAQGNQDPVFHNGDRVCFVGNSITNNGFFHEYIRLFYLTRFPGDSISFFNCGISGDDAGNVLKRLDDDVLSKSPTWSVVKLGMNDVRRGLYSVEKSKETGIEAERQQALDTYRKGLEEIIIRLMNAGSKIILQKPTIYDQTATLKSTNYRGVNDALKKCCEYIDTLAAKYHLPVVDYWTILNRINTAIQQKDPQATIIGPDRVHPQIPGHFIMFYQFLNNTFKKGPEDEIRLNGKERKTSCAHCNIDNVKMQGNDYEFTVSRQSLPFPVPVEVAQALQYVPFQIEFNESMLIVKKVKNGNYKLYIDTADAGIFSDKDLEKGINLSSIKSSPQYKQAEGLLKLLDRYREQEAHIRSVKLVDYDFLDEVRDEGMDSIRTFLHNLLESKYAGSEYLGFFKEKFDHYIQYKSRENEVRSALASISKMLYEQAVPKPHVYRLVYLDK